MQKTRRVIGCLLLLFGLSSCLAAQDDSPNKIATPPANSHAAQAPAFDVTAAVNTYLAKMPPVQRARSDAYFEGGYWLLFWDFLANAVAMWLLLHFGWSSGMRNLAERITRFRPLQTAIYWVQFFVVTSVLTFPLTVYEGFFREHSYGLLNQNFGQWFRDQAVQLAIGVVLGAVLVDSAVWSGEKTGQDVVGVGIGGDDSVCGIGQPDCAGLSVSACSTLIQSWRIRTLRIPS